MFQVNTQRLKVDCAIGIQISNIKSISEFAKVNFVIDFAGKFWHGHTTK